MTGDCFDLLLAELRHQLVNPSAGITGTEGRMREFVADWCRRMLAELDAGVQR